jgi:hypothetical protein
MHMPGDEFLIATAQNVLIFTRGELRIFFFELRIKVHLIEVNFHIQISLAVNAH